jgi:hypothetical protein
MADRHHFPAVVNFAVLAVLLFAGPMLAAADKPLPAPLAAPDAAAVDKALANARHYLIRQLNHKSGRAVLDYDEDSHRHGIETALVLRALSLAGEKYSESGTLRRGYAWLVARPRESTELVAMRIAAIAEVSSLDQQLYRCLADDVAWLVAAGSEEGNYGTESLAGQSQLAYNSALADVVTDALTLATKQDVLVPRDFWERNARAWIRNQLTAGGWKTADGWGGYRANFTYTAGGICGLTTSLERFDDRTDRELGVRARDALKLATVWLDEQFSLPAPRYSGDYCISDHHFPGPGIDSFDSSELQNRWLVNMARLKTTAHIKRIGRGGDPWSRLAAELVKFQNDDGSWGGSTWSSGIFQIQLTASGVIFLSSLEEQRGAVKAARPPR